MHHMRFIRHDWSAEFPGQTDTVRGLSRIDMWAARRGMSNLMNAGKQQ